MESYEAQAYGRSMPGDCSLKEYRKKYAPEHLRKNIVNLALAGYLLGAFNLGMGLWNGSLPQAGLAAVLLALNLGLHINKSKLCAVAILVCACGDLLLSFLYGGALTTWGGWIALGVFAISAINSMDKEFRKEIQRRNRER